MARVRAETERTAGGADASGKAARSITEEKRCRLAERNATRTQDLLHPALTSPASRHTTVRLTKGKPLDSKPP